MFIPWTYFKSIKKGDEKLRQVDVVVFALPGRGCWAAGGGRGWTALAVGTEDLR